MKPKNPLGQVEFIALMAMLAATVAFSIDAMLPSLPLIGADLSPADPDQAQLVLTSFILGMGLGTFVTGPLSDTFGRKPVMVAGSVLYCGAALAAIWASSLEALLIARVIQGLGAAGPRVVAMAMIRDIYAGRDMARIMSFVLLVFSLVPALAPTLGYYIAGYAGWRAIFVSFVVFAVVGSLWLVTRQPETLAQTDRRSLRVGELWSAVKTVFSHPTTRLSIVIQTLTFSMLFTVLSSTQLIFDQTYGQGDHMHLWFGGIAIVASSASLLNARLVDRIGMRAIIRATFMVQIIVSLAMIILTIVAVPYWFGFAGFVIWTASIFFQAGLTIGNLNALGMEPMGHIAGMAASLISAISTVGAVFIAAPAGLAFDGTARPAAMVILCCAVLALYLTTKIRRPSEMQSS